jgi:hypothetical protein
MINLDYPLPHSANTQEQEQAKRKMNTPHLLLLCPELNRNYNQSIINVKQLLLGYWLSKVETK